MRSEKKVTEAGEPQTDKGQSDATNLALLNEQRIEIYELHKAILRTI